METHTIQVPGAKLYYQSKGSGPLLLMMCGGSGDADGFASLMDELSKDFTVVSYDRRGYSRSPLDHPEEQSTIEIPTQADDAVRLIKEITQEPVYLFGASFGAAVGLEVVAKNPGLARALVAHEPPIHLLLPEEERMNELPQTGDPRALQQYMASMGVSPDPRMIAMLPKEFLERKAINTKHFMAREARAVRIYLPDFEALKNSTTKINIAGGETGRAYAPYRSATLVAERLGISLVEFPGNHVGMVSHPKEFAEKLRAVLGYP
jgi:pimeloyl-ACP methyl ester carboxylesterase